MFKDKPQYHQYTIEKELKTDPRRVMATVFALLAGVVIANILAMTIKPTLTNGVFAYKWEIVKSQTTSSSWLILGDSSAGYAVDPDIATRELGGEVLNLSTMGGWALLSDVWLLEAQIKNVGPPSSIILIHIAEVYPQSLNNQLLVQGPLNPLQWFSFDVKPELTVGETAELTFKRCLPLYHRSDILKQALKEIAAHPNILILPQSPPKPAYGPTGFFSQRQSAHGTTDALDTEAAQYLSVARNNNFKMSELNQASLEYLAELSNDYGITIYVANAPLYRELYEDPSFRQYYDDAKDSLRDWADSSPQIHYLDNLSLFDAQYLLSVNHLNADGAELYTQQLVELIKDVQ